MTPLAAATEWHDATGWRGGRTLNATVSLCSVSWPLAQSVFADAMEATFDSHNMHGPYLALWYRHCAPQGLKQLWTLEQDAFFSGSLLNFIGAYSTATADLIASGFRIATSQWWMWSCFIGRGREGWPRSLRAKSSSRT